MMTTGLITHWLKNARQALCLLICVLFVFPSFCIQPATASSYAPVQEEREESNKSASSDDGVSIQDSIHQNSRRLASHRSPIARSIETNASRSKQSSSIQFCLGPKDVYQNGLGTRLRC